MRKAISELKLAVVVVCNCTMGRVCTNVKHAWDHILSDVFSYPDLNQPEPPESYSNFIFVVICSCVFWGPSSWYDMQLETIQADATAFTYILFLKPM